MGAAVACVWQLDRFGVYVVRTCKLPLARVMAVDVRWAYVGLMLQAFHDRLKRIEEKLGIDDGDRTKAG